MRIHAVTPDVQTSDIPFDEWVHLSRYVDRLHVRLPGKTSSDIYRIASELLRRGMDKQTLVLHDRIDVALMLDMPIIHIGFRSPPVAVVRRCFPQLTIGVSVHSVSEAVQTAQDGADYVMFGHVFQTASKAGKSPQGLNRLRQVVNSVTVPVVAIGGITLANLAETGKTGVHGLAVQSGIFAASYPAKAAKAYKENAEKISTTILLKGGVSSC